MTKLPRRIAAKMPEHRVQLAVYALILGYQNYRTPARFQDPVDVFKCLFIMLHVLQDIEANHRVDLSTERLEVFGSSEIVLRDADVGPVSHTRAQPAQVLIVNVACDIQLPPRRQSPR